MSSRSSIVRNPPFSMGGRFENYDPLAPEQSIINAHLSEFFKQGDGLLIGDNEDSKIAGT